MKDYPVFKVIYFLGFVAIFVGDVQVPHTIPLSILISLVFVVRMFSARVSLAFFLLLGTLLPGMVNLTLAGYIDVQRDFATYYSICYGLFVLLFVGGFTYNEKLKYATIAGVFILCIWIFYSFVTSSGDVAGYYQIKLNAETPLGRSNYLAVFIGFCLLVSTFWLGWASLILLPAFLLTMSRTGIILMVVFLLLRYVAAGQYKLKAVCFALLIFGLLYYFWDHIYYYMDYIWEGFINTDSLHVRFRAWVATLDIIRVNPLIGVPRSYYKDALEGAVPGENLWDPHNSILHLIVSFGFIGFLFYMSYIFYVFREFYRASASNRFWKGVCWGYSLILIWSLFEPILLTPAIEILQAYLFVLARSWHVNRCFRSLVYDRHIPATTDYAVQCGQNRILPV